MAANNVISQILDHATQLGIEELGIKEKAARTWFRKEAERVTADPTRLMLSAVEKRRDLVIPGCMYLFSYIAKHADTLPYWDRYPVIFPVEIYDDGFLGINLHYLPHVMRAKLMDALMELAFNNKYDKNYRLRISYELLKSFSKYKYFKPCVKRYLYKQLRSRYYLIDWKEWSIAVFLPLERFQKMSKEHVWEESKKIIDNAKPIPRRKKKP